MGAMLLAAVAMFTPPAETQNSELPAVISRVAPSIPIVAFTAQLGGIVVIELAIGADGVPISTHAVEGHPLLREPTEKAALLWRFASSREGSRTFRLVFVYPKLTYGNPVSIVVLPYQTELKIEPHLYVRLPENTSHVPAALILPESISHIPADWRPGDRCRVHHQILKKDKVEIIYGLMAFRANYEGAERVLFPNANIVAYGGCVIMTDPVSGKVSPRFAEVLYCSRCRFDEKRWSKANRRNRPLVKRNGDWPR